MLCFSLILGTESSNLKKSVAPSLFFHCEPPLPIIHFDIVRFYPFEGQPSSKQLYIKRLKQYKKNTHVVVFCLNYLEVNQDSPLKEDESQDHSDQAADETQTQTAEEGEPMTMHFAVNCKLQLF